MSDEVSDFLRSVELLKGRREEEDEARSRELEEKILQEKRERQARRAGAYAFDRRVILASRVSFGCWCANHNEARQPRHTTLCRQIC